MWHLVGGLSLCLSALSNTSTKPTQPDLLGVDPVWMVALCCRISMHCSLHLCVNSSKFSFFVLSYFRSMGFAGQYMLGVIFQHSDTLTLALTGTAGAAGAVTGAMMGEVDQSILTGPSGPEY